jgi:hypothetical protein
MIASLSFAIQCEQDRKMDIMPLKNLILSGPLPQNAWLDVTSNFLLSLKSMPSILLLHSRPLQR